MALCNAREQRGNCGVAGLNAYRRRARVRRRALERCRHQELGLAGLQLLLFFVITFAIAWSAFLVSSLLPVDTSGQSVVPLRTMLLLFGTFAPAIVSIALVARARGADGVRELLRRLFIAPTTLRWYLFALGYVAAIKLAGAMAHRLITGAWPTFGIVSPFTIAISIVITTPLQAGEEIGWRGYALPELARRIGIGWGSVVLGLLVSAWHLPLFIVPGHANYGQSFPLFVVGATALSVAVAWLYLHTNGSLFMAMLMHAAVNHTVGIVPTRATVPGHPFAIDASLVTWLAAGLLSIVAAYLFFRMQAVRMAPFVAR